MNSFILFGEATTAAAAGTPSISLSTLGLVVAGVACLGGAVYYRNAINNIRAAVTTLTAGVLLLTSWGGTRTYQGLQYDAKVRDYVLASYKTEDPTKAKKYLVSALDYLKEAGADKGHSAIFAGGQTDDLSEWTDDLAKVVNSVDERIQVGTSAANDETEKPLPWRKALVSGGFVSKSEEGKVSFNAPSGMQLAPNNYSFFMWGCAAAFLTLVGGVWTTGATIKAKCDEKKCGTCNGSGKVQA